MKLVILDRDGVINEDSDDYIKSVDEFIPYPDSLDAIVRLNQAGYLVAVATNQSGIGRGYYDENTLKAMHEKLAQQLDRRGGHIDYIAWCPHRPDQDCDCRKPRPGLLQQIARHFDTSLNGVTMVGDKPADIAAARAAGARPVLVRTGKGERTLARQSGLEGVPVYASLSVFVDDFLSQES